MHYLDASWGGSFSQAAADDRDVNMVEDDAIELVTRRLMTNAGVTPAERDAFMALLGDVETYEAGTCLVQRGASCRRPAILLNGFAFGQIGWRHSRRQIVGIYLAGDLLGFHGAVTGQSSEAIVAATECKVVTLDADALMSLIESMPRVGLALLTETLVAASIAREWIMNVGQRTARQRLAHLCCEMAWREREAGLGDGQTFSLPMTPGQLADATGLSRLHVNHTLQKLEADELIVRDRSMIRVVDDDRLKEEAGFDDLYLCRGATEKI